MPGTVRARRDAGRKVGNLFRPRLTNIAADTATDCGAGTKGWTYTESCLSHQLEKAWGSFLDGPAHCAQMVAKAQGGRLLALGEVGAELKLGP